MSSSKLDQARKQHKKRGYDSGVPTLYGVRSQKYILTKGVPVRPVFMHDHGFLENSNGDLDKSKMQKPTEKDKDNLSDWRWKLRFAKTLRPDLSDATKAYENFLSGGGKPQSVNYPGFLVGDSDGRRVYQSIVEDVKKSAEHHLNQHQNTLNRIRTIAGPNSSNNQQVNKVKPIKSKFQMYSGIIPVGGKNPRYPYPATENWQKAIGGHSIWLAVTVEALPGSGSGMQRMALDITIYAEDMYNFNPKQKDISTNIPDSENGRFEVVGLGHEYINKSTVFRKVDYEIKAETLYN